MLTQDELTQLRMIEKDLRNSRVLLNRLIDNADTTDDEHDTLQDAYSYVDDAVRELEQIQ